MQETCFFHPHWPVIYHDNHLLAVYKPAGLLVQKDSTGEPSLLDLSRKWIKLRHKKPGEVFLGLVHRLDRPVAGVVLFCRTSKAAGRISAQFRRSEVTKIYWAVVEGTPGKLKGELCHHLLRRRELSTLVRDQPCHRSQEARLRYKVLDSREQASLVEIFLETGRHHQIRCQLAHIGHPVLGDLRYGARQPLPQRQIALLARELIVTHPTLKSPLSLNSPLPKEWPWPQLSLMETTGVPWNWSDLETSLSDCAELNF